MESENRDKLVVLWTSGDREVARNMVFMYTKNSRLKGWWGEVRLVIWGPSAKLLSEDTELQEELEEMEEAGVMLEACKACSDRYGVSDVLEKLHINVKYMGAPLTNYLKEGFTVLTI